MIASKTHEKWKKLIQSKKSILDQIKLQHDIIEQLIPQIRGNNGIKTEHSKIEELLNTINIISDLRGHLSSRRKLIERYGETAYLIWALNTVYKREDLLLASVQNWGDGIDDGEGSQFRNFEFECHTALRFLEAGAKVTAIQAEGNPEFCINDYFVIECKRPTYTSGLFKNTLKARKQVDNTGKPGILIFNLDDLNDFKSNNTSTTIYNELMRFSKISEYGLGVTNNYLIGVIFEYVGSDSTNGSYIYAINNHVVTEISEHSKIKRSVIKALTGATNSVFEKNQIAINERYPGDFEPLNKKTVEAFYTANILPNV